MEKKIKIKSSNPQINQNVIINDPFYSKIKELVIDSDQRGNKARSIKKSSFDSYYKL